MTATPRIVDRETWQKQIDTAARQGEGAHPRGDAIAEARWRLPMVAVDPTSAVVGAAGGVPLIDTFQEPVAAVCVGARRRVVFRNGMTAGGGVLPALAGGSFALRDQLATA